MACSLPDKYESSALPLLSLSQNLNMGVARVKKRQRRKRSFIESLPHDLIVEIVASVAAASLSDLSNTKLACKKFREAAKDGYVFQKASMETLPAMRWRRSSQADLFLARCQANGNPGALYQQGMMEYFSKAQKQIGIDLLKLASDSGHLDAAYLLGIIFLSNGSSRNEGEKLLKKVESRNKSEIGKCHARSRKLLREIWINNVIDPPEPACMNSECRNGGRRGFPEPSEWSWTHDDWRKEMRFCSESCKWDHQLNLFCNDLIGK